MKRITKKEAIELIETAFFKSNKLSDELAINTNPTVLKLYYQEVGKAEAYLSVLGLLHRNSKASITI